jgi:hypothetical protein
MQQTGKRSRPGEAKIGTTPVEMDASGSGE